MESKGLIRALLLLRYLFQNSDEIHPVSAGDILAYWESCRIHSDRRRVYHDIALLQEFGIDIVCVKSKQNQYFVGNRPFELPELKLLVDSLILFVWLPMLAILTLFPDVALWLPRVMLGYGA